MWTPFIQKYYRMKWREKKFTTKNFCACAYNFVVHKLPLFTTCKFVKLISLPSITLLAHAQNECAETEMTKKYYFWVAFNFAFCLLKSFHNFFNSFLSSINVDVLFEIFRIKMIVFNFSIESIEFNKNYSWEFFSTLSARLDFVESENGSSFWLPFDLGMFVRNEMMLNGSNQRSRFL